MGDALTGFNSGFHDGFAGEKRQRNQGGVYLRSFKRGAEAKARHLNGGEDMPPQKSPSSARRNGKR